MTNLNSLSLIEKFESSMLKPNIVNFKAGDTVKVHVRITEGNKERIQVYEGVVIRRRRRNEFGSTFTVRKITAGVERTFLLHSPRIEKIEVVAIGRVRRAKLYYLRERSGKSARIKSKINH
jgi:large subunit ribosomal protein L19